MDEQELFFGGMRMRDAATAMPPRSAAHGPSGSVDSHVHGRSPAVLSLSAPILSQVIQADSVQAASEDACSRPGTSQISLSPSTVAMVVRSSSGDLGTRFQGTGSHLLVHPSSSAHPIDSRPGPFLPSETTGKFLGFLAWLGGELVGAVGKSVQWVCAGFIRREHADLDVVW
jgi:hypothetical protein